MRYCIVGSEGGKRGIRLKSKKNAQFVIEEIGKKTAEIFGKLQLGTFIPN